MSDMGTIAGRYSSIEELAELVDTVILAINSGRAVQEKQRLEELGHLLLDAGSKKPSNLRALRLATLLQDYLMTQVQAVRTLGEKLVMNRTDTSVKDGLNEIAALLEHERAQAADRLRHGP